MQENSHGGEAITDPARPAAAAGDIGPVAESERIITLDVLRGLAIFGIFMVNIPFFAAPLFETMQPERLAEAPASHVASWWLVRVLFEYKFISLFSMLFGIGMVVQMTRAQRAGRPFAIRFFRRAVVLMGIGLFHGLFIWYGDILFIYGIMGLVLLLFRDLKPRTLLLLAAGTYLLGALVLAGFMSLGVLAGDAQRRAAATGPQQQAAETADTADASDAPAEAQPGADDRMERWREAMSASGGNLEHPKWAEAERIAYGEGPFIAALAMRAISFAGMLVFAGIFMGFGLRVLALFLLGMALMKLGFFDASRRRWHVAFLTGGLAVGLPAELAVMLTYHAEGYAFTWPGAAAEVLHYVASIGLTFAYVGGACLLVSAGALRPLLGALACVGRMALTNYLMQSLVAGFIMYWWGLGLFGTIDLPQQLGLVVMIFLGQVIFSILWLRVFTMGPMEWLWRCATYWRWQPLARRATAHEAGR